MVVPEERSKTIVVALDGRVSSRTVPHLCEVVHTALEASDADLVVCDLGALAEPSPLDLDLLGALARLQLMTKRLGRSLRLRNVPGQLEDLLKLTGLDEVLL